MLNTLKIQDKGNVKIVAHRGLSGIELENTNPAFVAVANELISWGVSYITTNILE